LTKKTHLGYNSAYVEKSGANMILADTLTLLTGMGPTALSQVLDKSGYTMCSFKSAKFLGMTNGGQFCYSVTYYNENSQSEDVGKVYVNYNQASGFMTAEF